MTFIYYFLIRLLQKPISFVKRNGIHVFVIASLILSATLIHFGEFFLHDEFSKLSEGWQKFASGTKEAMLVAAFLAFSDIALKKALSKDVFGFVYGINHPVGVKDEINAVLSNPFVREDYEIRIRLLKFLGEDYYTYTQKKEASDGCRFLIQRVQYRIVNLSSINQQYTIKFSSSVMLENYKPIITKIYIDNKLRRFKSREDKVNREVYISETVWVNGNSHKDFYLEDIREVAEFDEIPVFFTHTTINPRVTVDETTAQEFRVEPISLKSTEIKENKVWDCVDLTCDIQRTFLPGQALTIKWGLKKN